MSNPNDLQLTLSLRATDQGLVGTVREAANEADKLNKKLNQAAGSTQGFSEEASKADTHTDGLSQSMKEGATSASDLSDSLDDAKGEAGQLDKNLDQAGKTTQKFSGHTKKADKDTDSFAKKLGGGAITAAQWAAGIAAAGAAVGGFVVAVNTDAIRQTDMFAESLGMSTQVMTEWEYAAETMGMTNDQLQQTFQDVSDKIGDLAATGGGEAVDVFETMNVQLGELMAMSPDQQILAIADAMEDVNQHQKVFFMESLANQSTRLLPLLKDNAALLKRLQLEAQVLGISISDIDAAKVTQAGVAMGKVKGLIQGAANEATIALAPVLTGIADSLVDSAVEAGGFESAMIGAVDTSVTGIGHVLDVGQQFLIWGTQAQIGLLTVGQYGTAAMAGIADTTAALINLSLYPMQQTIAWIIDQLAGLVELGASLGGPFADSFSEASAWLKTFSGDVEQFHVTGADIIALNEQMQTSLANAATELDTLLNTGAPSEDLKAWVQGLREESEQAAQAQVDLRAESTKTGEIVGTGVDVDPYAKLNKELKEQLALVGLTAREVAIETNLRKLNADATKEQKDEITRLTNELYDAQEKESLADALFDIDANDLEKQMQPLLDQIDYLKEQMAFDGMSGEMKKNIGDGIKQLKDDVDQVKFDHITDNAKDGLRSIQTMTEEGSKGYQALGIAVNAISAVQAVQAVVLQLSSGDPYTVFARAAAAAAAVASLGFSISGFGGSDSKPTMSSEQIGFETAKLDNESVVSRLDQQIELLEAIERNGSAAAINVDLAAAEYQGAIFEWVEDVFDSSRMGYVNAMFDASSSAWAAIEEHYKNLEIANPYEIQGDQIRINAEQYYRDPSALIAVIKDISQSSNDGFNYSGPFGQSIADEYGYGEDAHEAFRAAMRSSFTELQGYLNDWAVTSIESLTDLSDASETMKESFDAITGTSRYATEELNEAYAALDKISGGDYAGYLEDNIDAIASAEGWLEQLTNSYDEHGNQLTNFQLLLSKDVELFEDQAAALEQFNAILGGTFEGGAEEALNFMNSIELVAESMQKTRELEDQILELTNSEEYLITMRQRELETLTESQQALQKQVWALEDWADAVQIGDMIDDALRPLSSAERTLDSANRAMVALGMTGITYYDALTILDDYDTDALVGLADALGMSFAEIQEMIQQIINGNEQITGGGSGVLSVADAEAAVDAATIELSDAEDAVWNFADVINESFGGVIPTIDEFNAAFGDMGSDELATIKSTYSDLIDQIGGLPDSIGELRENYFDQFDSMELVKPTEGIAKQISDVYEEFLGRLPDADGLDYWLTEFNNGVSFESITDSITGGIEAALYDAGGINLDVFDAFDEVFGRLPTQQELNDAFADIGLGASIQDVINDLMSTTEATLYDQFKDLEGDYSHYLDSAADSDGPAGLGIALQQLETAKVNLGAAQTSLSNAMASGTESVADSTNNAAISFLNSIKNELGGFDLDGEDLEQYELDLWYSNMVAQANELGVELTQLNELYGKKQVAITEKYADEAAEALQKALDFDANIQSQIDSFGLDGERLELFQLNEWRDAQIKQAEKVGGDVELIEELYGKKRVSIVEKYADEAAEAAQKAAEQLVEDAGLNDYLQSVSDYVEDQSKIIRDSYSDQVAIIEQWQDVAKDLRNYVEQIRLSELSPLGPGEKLEEAQTNFAQLLIQAEAGDLEAASKLTGAADTYLNLSDQYYGRSDAYTAVFNDVTSSLDDLGIDLLAANNQDAIERLNEQMKGELEDLSNYARQELAWAQAQANSLTGIEGALGSWPTQFDEMLSGLAGDIGSAVAAAIPDRSSVSVSVSAPSTPYSPDKNGSYWDLKAAQNIPGGASITDPNLPAFATGGDHLGGWRIVGERGPELEATGPSRIFNAMDTQRILSGGSSSVSDPALLALIESLVASNERLEAEVAALRSDRSHADKVANKKRDDQIKATKKVGKSAVETV